MAVLLKIKDSANRSDDSESIRYFEAEGLPLSSVILALFDQSDDCIKVISPNGALQFMNCNGRQAMQVDDFELIRGMPWHSLWPDDSQDLVEDSVSKANAGLHSRFEAFCPTAKGEPRWWEVRVSPLQSEDGRVVATLSTSRDISDSRRRELAAATVAAEMRHRLLNAHSVGAAVLLASARAEPEHRDFANAAAARLARLAMTQAKLLEVSGGLLLSDLAADIATMFEQSGGHLDLGELPPTRLDEQRARALSLALGELATNSLKYGSLAHGGAVKLDSRSEDGILHVDWEETFTAGQVLPGTTSTGQGAELVGRILRLFDGSIEAGKTETGYAARIRLPLDKA